MSRIQQRGIRVWDSQEPRVSTALRASEVVRVWLLGGFRVSVGSRFVREDGWRLKKAGSLVKLLALARGHRLHRERVMDLLWPDLASAAAANNLHRTLHAARKAIDPHAPAADTRYLRLGDGQIELCQGDAVWVDAEAFEEAAAVARRTRDPAVHAAAADLYAGDLLPGDLYEPWAEERRESLRQSYLSLLLEMAKLYEESGAYDAAIEACKKAVDEDRTLEEAHAGLMRLYALGGRRREALLQYEQLRGAVADQTGNEPGSITELLRREIIHGEPPSGSARRVDQRPEVPVGPVRGNLPQPYTSFVGRERETLEIKRSLSMTRLLTLTGAGGCGKTRLALEVARDLSGAYPDGVWLIELAPLSEEGLVARTVAEALGVRKQPGRPLDDTLVDYLRFRRALLILDNCEHLISTCARLVASLLGSCRHLRVLATSREALGIDGETNRLVPSLAVPDPGQPPTAESVTRYEAVRLFAERARSRTTFELSAENAGTVAAVCRRLDGIPLAIELATARLTVLSVGQIAERLEDSLGLLTFGNRTASPRQRTLRATLEWSYDLLSEPERTLFRRLSVFAGGWTLEAAESVGAGGQIEQTEVLDLLSRLVDKSLVVAEAGWDGASRYGMLEPVRQFADEELEGSTESSAGVRQTDAERARERHAEYFLALAEAAEPELLGAGQGEWLQRLRIELGNLRAALTWSIEADEDSLGRAELRLRLAAALWRFWDVQGFEEGKGWLEAALERDSGGSPAVRAKALGGLGWILLFQQDYRPAITVLEEAIVLYEEVGDLSGTGFALANLGFAVLHGGYHERVPAFVREGKALMRETLDGPPHAFLGMILASAAMEMGDLDAAVSQLEESLALSRELGNLRDTSMGMFMLAMSEVEQGNLDRGAPMLDEGARITRNLKDRLGTAYYLLALGKVSFLRGSPVRAARLWGAAEALREQMGMSLSSFDLARSGYEPDLAGARSLVDATTWAEAWAEGRAMAPDSAVEYALSSEDLVSRATKAPGRTALTSREREVALLVSRGLTNRHIAAELSISHRTVDTHVGRILKKLGLDSREQVAGRLTGQPHETG